MSDGHGRVIANVCNRISVLTVKPNHSAVIGEGDKGRGKEEDRERRGREGKRDGDRRKKKDRHFGI